MKSGLNNQHLWTYVAAASVSLALAANAVPIVPVAWKQSNSINLLRTATNLSNTNGMDATETYLYNQDGVGGVGETTSADNKEWLTTSNGDEAAAAAAGKVWIIADLGAVYDLGTINIWNFNWDNTPGTPLTSLNARGVSQFDILVRNTVADTDNGTVGGAAINLDNPNDNATIDNDAVFNLGTSNQWQQVLANQSLPQASNDDTYTGQSFDLTGNTARFVAIRVDSGFTPAGIGLGKVRINGTVPLTSLYWDTNGATAGAGGVTPGGIWDTSTANWSTESAGASATATWSAGRAYFAAGTDATGTYTVSVSGTPDIAGLVFQEGAVTVTNGALRIVSGDTFMSANLGATGTVYTPLSQDASSRPLAMIGGTVRLLGNNTYTGPTTVSGGTLYLGGNNSGATGGMNINGGIVQFEAANSINGSGQNVTNNSAGTVVFGPTFGPGNIASALSGRIASASAGVIAADNYAGTAFDFNAGSLSSAFLGAVGNVSYTGTLTPSGTTYRLGGGGGTLTMAQAITGSNDLLIKGNVILTNSNNHIGTNDIIGGNLTLSGLGNLGNPANNLTLGGGGLDLGGSSQTVGEVSITAARASGQTITNGSLTGTSYAASNPGGNAIISANLLAGGSAGFTKSGAGTVTLSGNNTYTGLTDITGGAINIQNANALGTTAGGTTVANGATLQLQGGLSFAAEPLTLGWGSAQTPTLQSVSGSNIWTGTIDTSGSGTYTRIQSDTNLLTLPNTITGNDPASSVILQGAGNILVSGKITGLSGLLSSALGGAGGTRTLSNPANDFSGNLTIVGGRLKLGASGVIPDGTGNGNVVFNADASTSATFDLNGYSETINGLSSTVNGIVDNTATNTTSTLTVGGNDQTTSYVGVIRNTGGTLALTKIGSGTLILTGTNTYTGNTIVKAGTLELGVASLAASSTVSVTNDAILQLDFAETNVVAGFITNGVSLPVGVYSAANVAPFIAGGGSLEVAPPQPVIAPVTVSGTDLVVSVVTVSPYNYVLQSTTNLAPTIIWKNESTNAGTGANLNLNVPIEPGKPEKFLRFWVY